MTFNTIVTCLSLPVVLVLGIVGLALIVTHQLPLVPELETMETFMWVHKRP